MHDLTSNAGSLMGKPHYFRFFTGDYIRATPHLTAEEHGAYLLIIMAMFDAGGDLPNDQVLLQRVSRVAVSRWSRVWKTLEPFFSTTVEGGINRITQLRIKQEYQLSANLISKNSAKGNASAEAKRLKALTQASTAVEPQLSRGSTNQSQSQEREREKGRTSASASGSEGTTLRQGSEQTQHPPRQPPPARPAPLPAVLTGFAPAIPDDPLLDGMPAFGPDAFKVLFGQWPGQDNPKFNERVADAEVAFFKHIHPDNYASFVHALNAQLLGFANDHSPTRRKELGSFRTFCEERWTKYKDPAPPPAPGPAKAEIVIDLSIPMMDP